MIYQLPNGRIVFLTLEQFLDLTDEDIEFLVGYGPCTYANSPFYGSVTKRPGKSSEKEEDKSIDYIPDIDDIDFEDIDINRIIELDEGEFFFEE